MPQIGAPLLSSAVTTTETLLSLPVSFVGSKGGPGLPLFPSTGQSVSMDQALGVAASLGLSVAVARWIFTATMRSTAMLDNQPTGSTPKASTSSGGRKGQGLTNEILRFFRRLIRRLILDEQELRLYRNLQMEQEQPITEDDLTVVTHLGSCHCGSVRFELKAPKTILAKEGPGKIQYRYAEVKSSDLRVLAGQNYLKTYYVVAAEGAHDRGAHAFCGRCGCHILFAPSKNATQVRFNVNCVDGASLKVKLTDSKSNVSLGTFSETTSQYGEDQLSTISETKKSFPLSPPRLRDAGGSFNNYESLSVGESDEYNLTSDDDMLELSSHRGGASFSYTPSTVGTGSMTATATDTQSLPALRIPGGRGVSDLSSVITDSDSFSVSRSEYGYGVNSPSSKPLPQLRDQMKHFMKKHVTPPKAKKSQSE